MKAMPDTPMPEPVAADMPERVAAAPLDEAAARVGDRWKLLIVAALLDGSRRFNQLQEELPARIASNVLAQRLKDLEREGLVVSRPYSRRPLRVAYQLTASGLELAGALRLLAQWGARRAGEAGALRHAACGTPMEARWYCPTCARLVDDDEPPGELRFV
jgi:DNA-binding HxlR family transcriptional regulator